MLLLVGLGSSLYLGHLYLRVHRPGGGPVDSFCNINQAFNCVTVATSDYSTVLGLPIALLGIEFFAGALGLMLLSHVGVWGVRRWDSLLVLLCGPGLLACGVLAWISATYIHSFCIMCCLVYLVVGLTALVLIVAARGRVRELIVEGPREFMQWARGGPRLIGLAALLLVVASQFLWVPRLLRAGPQPPEASFNGLPSSGLSIGPPDAPIKIEEFTDFQCPYCEQAHRVMMQVLARFPGKIHLTHRDYPLDQACNPYIPRPFHPQACLAAFYARCAAQENRYWAYEMLLFGHRIMLSEHHLQELATTVKLDPRKLEACASSQGIKDAVLRDIEEGRRRGIEGTPAFFINGEMVVGARPLEFWVERISRLLGQQ